MTRWQWVKRKAEVVGMIALVFFLVYIFTDVFLGGPR